MDNNNFIDIFSNFEDFDYEAQKLIKRLINAAKNAAMQTKCKVSGFHVGAAIMDEEELIYTGCNIETDAYTTTIHAECGALAQWAVADGKKIQFIAVWCDGKKLWFPCALCRQMLYEWAGPDVIVITAGESGYDMEELGVLYPLPFAKRALLDSHKKDGL